MNDATPSEQPITSQKWEDAPLYSPRQLDHLLFLERRRNRHGNRWIWLLSMILTVAICAALRRQRFGDELPWYYIPVVGVTLNYVCFWLGNKMMFGWRK